MQRIKAAPYSNDIIIDRGKEGLLAKDCHNPRMAYSRPVARRVWGFRRTTLLSKKSTILVKVLIISKNVHSFNKKVYNSSDNIMKYSC